MTADPLNKIGMTGGTAVGPAGMTGGAAVVPGSPATYITLPSATLWLPLERAASASAAPWHTAPRHDAFGTLETWVSRRQASPQPTQFQFL